MAYIVMVSPCFIEIIHSYCGLRFYLTIADFTDLADVTAVKQELDKHPH